MSNTPHPDLNDFYETINQDDQGLWQDIDDDEDDGEFYLDVEDGMEIDDDEEEDDDDEYGEGEEDDDDEDGEFGDDAQFPGAYFARVGADEDEDEDEDEGEGIELPQAQWLQLAALLSSNSTSSEVRQTLLSRLLSGPSRTRSGLTRVVDSESTITPEERRRRMIERKKRDQWYEPQKKADPRGVELLKSGEFGKVGDWRLPGRWRRPRAGDCDRRIKRGGIPPVAKATVPNTHGTVVAAYPSIPYVGQFAGPDYGVFYTATQYFTLHLYSTQQSRITRKPRPSIPAPQAAVPTGAAAIRAARGGTGMVADEDDEDEDEDWGGRRRSHAERTEDTSLKKIKTVQGVEGSWTVTDADADRKGEKMIYSSITPYVHMLYTSEHDSEHIQLDFSSASQRTSWGYDRFGIWSIRFSADGKEVVAGAGGGRIMVYDIEAERRSLSVFGHHDDVNAVCFADESSTNILVSGSDDGYVKVWDRRSLSSSTPSGVLVGATEGITYTSPKGDGRYIVVNSKDQAARLYDLRKMRSHSEFEGEPDAVQKYGASNYDYRNAHYPRPRYLAHPKDCSVMTFRGHSVLRTLIRCHFSPRESTGQSYIYSGSADGMIHIWSLDGRVVQVLNRAQSIPLRQNGAYTDPSAPEPPRALSSTSQTSRHNNDYYTGLNYTVRDVAWHGYEPTLMSTCWEVEGNMRRGGSLGRHEFKGLGKGGLKRMEDWVEKSLAETEE